MGKKKQREQAIRADERRRIIEGFPSHVTAHEVPGGIEVTISESIIIGHTANKDDQTVALCGESLSKSLGLMAPVRENVGEDLRDRIYFCHECADQLLAEYNRMLAAGHDLSVAADRVAERMATIRRLSDI